MGYYKSIIEMESPQKNYLSLSDYKETHPFRFNPKLVRSSDFGLLRELELFLGDLDIPQETSPGKTLYLNYPKR